MATALVVGMAKSGVGSAKLLYKNGYRVIINDIKHDISGLSEALCGIEYENRLGCDPKTLLDGVDLMILSPVIPIFSELAKLACDKGIEVIGEIELGYRYCGRGANFVCISGTNGKTTCTALTGELFKAAGRHTFVLGNIGVPITEYAMDISDGDTVVAEVAALQLESIKQFHANSAAMVNISEDHLNRFGSMEKYIAAKCRVFENQTENDFAVLNYDDDTVRNMSRLTRARVVYFSQKTELEYGAFIRDGAMFFKQNGVETRIIDTSELLIPGRHNVENALVCACLAIVNGIDAKTVAEVFRSFKGVEHRIEFVLEHDGIEYYNDSKGTNPDSTMRAVEAMQRPTVLILGVGNYDKHSDFVPLFRMFKDNDVRAVVASGINVPAILEAANRTGFRNVKVENGSLRDMVVAAREMACEGYSILLSPAAASWGMFTDFEERGRVFKDTVMELCAK